MRKPLGRKSGASAGSRISLLTLTLIFFFFFMKSILSIATVLFCSSSFRILGSFLYKEMYRIPFRGLAADSLYTVSRKVIRMMYLTDAIVYGAFFDL